MFNLKSLKVFFVMVIVLIFVYSFVTTPACAQGKSEGQKGIPPGLAKAAWVDDGKQKWDVKANVSTVDGVGVVLRDRPVPIDRAAYEETLYAAFKSGDLPDYDIFTITPGFLSPISPKIIEVDYIGLKKDGNKTFLELVYKTNKAFEFDIGLSYSQDSEFTNIYPVTSPRADIVLTIRARETMDWQTASYEINPAIIEEFAKLDLVISYLEKLDKNWRAGEQKFVWDESKISVDSASVIGESMKSRFGVPKIRLLSYGKVRIAMSYNLIVLRRNIVIVTKDDTRMEGTIAITF